MSFLVRRRYHALRKAFLAAAVAGVAVWWRGRPFRVAVQGGSMEPALQAGDCLVAFRPGRIRRGDLVVLEHPQRPGFEVVKRVEALPGERFGDRILGPEEYWLVGDQPAASTDSRTFGPVGRPAIRGVVKLRYWPPSRLAAFR